MVQTSFGSVRLDPDQTATPDSGSRLDPDNPEWIQTIQIRFGKYRLDLENCIRILQINVKNCRYKYKMLLWRIVNIDKKDWFLKGIFLYLKMCCFIKFFFNQMGKICVKIEKQKPIFDVDIVLSYKLFVHVATVYAVFWRIRIHIHIILNPIWIFRIEPHFLDLSQLFRSWAALSGCWSDLPDMI